METLYPMRTLGGIKVYVALLDNIASNTNANALATLRVLQPDPRSAPERGSRMGRCGNRTQCHRMGRGQARARDNLQANG